MQKMHDFCKISGLHTKMNVLQCNLRKKRYALKNKGGK